MLRKFGWILLPFLSSITMLLADLTPQKYTSSPPTTPFRHLEFSEIEKFNRQKLSYAAQSPHWQSQMNSLADRLVLAKVRSVYFVHGTFVGTDPMGIINCIKCVYPELPPDVEREIREILKKNADELMKDQANYIKEYVEIFSQALGKRIPCHNFHWSSGNHHLARLQGAIKLTRALAQELREKTPGHNEKILLIGHSHAGQLFALLTNFLASSPGVEQLEEIAQESGVNMEGFAQDLEQIRQVQLDIVTMGTPPRYGWGEGDNYRLLNVINHRGDGYRAGSIFGLLVTADGDYIQQWGISGTDLLASTEKALKLNDRLNKILGPGLDPFFWLDNAPKRMRVPHYGKTLLVDYKDGNILLPNFLSSFFGHGIYTRFEAMLFNTRLIVQEFYE